MSITGHLQSENFNVFSFTNGIFFCLMTVSRAALLCKTFDDESDTGNYDGRPQLSQIDLKTDDGHSDIHKGESQLSAMASSKPLYIASHSPTPWPRTILTFLHKELRSSRPLRTHRLVLL